MTRRLVFAILLLVVSAGSLRAQVGARVANWEIPGSLSKAEDVGPPVTFVGVVPCRIVDTRDAAGPYGGPIISAGQLRNFDLNSGPCTGIPGSAIAYSLNFTATQTQGPGDLRVWPAGEAPPLVSTLNYVGGTTVANAAIVPASSIGEITVTAAVSGTHLLIDINGYFTHSPNVGNRWEFVVDAPGTAAFTAENTHTHLSQADRTEGVRGTVFSIGDHSAAVAGFNNSGGGGEVGGVLGLAGQPAMPLYGAAGIRGESAGFFGVLGISRNHIAVAGSNVTGGMEQTWATLGHDDSVAIAGGGNSSISGSKSFVEPHPADPAKVIQFVSLEGNEAGTYFRGRAKLERGIARIPVPDHFRMVTEEEGLRVQVTPIGELAIVAVVQLGLDGIVVKGSRDVEFFYTVNGVRKGYARFRPIVEETFFVPRSADYRMPGSLSPEAKRKLVANGTYNADGTVNMETAKRLRWTETWKGGVDSSDAKSAKGKR